MAKKIFTGKRVLFKDLHVVEVADWDVFEPQGGEVLFENMVSLISPGTELSRLHGTHSAPGTFPTNTGYISIGRIAKVGAGVTKLKPGDMVFSGLGHVSHAIFKADNKDLRPVPKGVPLTEIIWAKLAVIPLWGVQTAQVRIGATVGVFGLGVIGQLAAQLAKLAGGMPVIGVDLNEKRLQVAKSCGVDVIVNGSGNVKAEIDKATDGYGLDCVIEVTGTPHVAHTLFDYCAQGAVVSILGGVHKPVTLDLYTNFQKKCITMVGAHTGGTPNEASVVYPYNMDHNFNYLVRAITAGVLKVKPLTSKFVSFREAPKMYEALSDKNSDVINVAFDWKEVYEKSNLVG